MLCLADGESFGDPSALVIAGQVKSTSFFRSSVSRSSTAMLPMKGKIYISPNRLYLRRTMSLTRSGEISECQV